ALEWNDDGDTLSIIPAEPLPYAVGYGDDPSVVAPETFTVRIDPRAVDRAGNPLADGIAFSFTTLRELSIGIAPVHALTRALTPSELLFTLDEPIVVGDDEEDLAIRSTLTFDLATLPDEAQSVISATLATRRVTKGEAGTPFADLG